LQLLSFVYALTSDLLIQPIKSNVELKIQPRLCNIAHLGKKY